MTAPSTSPPYDPHTLVVARGWLRLGLPAAVGVDSKLPPLAAPTTPQQITALRSLGFVRLTSAGGTPSVENPMRHPVMRAECFVAPAQDGSSIVQTNAAARLGQWVKTATDNPALMGRLLDFPALGLGAYLPARVHTVVALSEPTEVPGDPSNFARFDISLLFHWSAA